MKGKDPKRIWYDNMFWKVINIYRPTEYDTYILIQRKSDTMCHPNEQDVVLMELIDPCDQECYPDNAEVRTLMFCLTANRSELTHGQTDGITSKLKDIWLNFAKRFEREKHVDSSFYTY